jgi:Beta-1,3-glucanase
MLAILPRPAAEFNQSTLLIDSDPLDSENPADYYANAVTNHYPQIMHATTIEGRGYAFPYDDLAPAGAPVNQARSPIRPRRCSA